MRFKLVLVEREDTTENKIISSSGILFDEKFVLITSNVLVEPYLQKSRMKLREHDSIIFNPFGDNKVLLNVVLHGNDSTFEVRTGSVFAMFHSRNIKNSYKYFKNFAIDTLDNNGNVTEVLSIFFILAIDSTSTLRDFRNSTKIWWDLVGRINIRKCDEISIESSAFGNRNFMYSLSRGIVSNIIGDHFSLILSDCPSTPGSEGSPVYLERYKKCLYPAGIVLSSVNFWRGEWTGLTIIADIRNILFELIDSPIRLDNFNKNIFNHLLLANCEFSLVQIYSGSNWGTAILLDSKKGIFITNSHVIVEEDPSLFYKMKKFIGKTLYQTSINSGYDLALVQCKTILRENLKSILVSKEKLEIGEIIYAAGFSLFPKECNPSPTISRGCITKKNKYMLRTTCSVHAGASGGAILNKKGCLIGIIVCNTKLNKKNSVFPKMNMGIPYTAIGEIIEKYIQDGDIEDLRQLDIMNTEIASVWNLEGKL